MSDCPTRLRLARAFARLESLQIMRGSRANPLLGRAAEEQIIWRELLELELQEVDEQIRRISESCA
jgi:hypothetical protein